MIDKLKFIIFALMVSCAPFESIGEYKTVLLEEHGAVVEVSAAMGISDRWETEWNFVFVVDGEGDSLICQIVILELPDSLLELVEVPILGITYKKAWSKTAYHASRLPDLGWSARLIDD